MFSNRHSTRKPQSGGATINSDVGITWITMIAFAMDWFKTFEVPTFELNEITSGNNEYIDK